MTDLHLVHRPRRLRQQDWIRRLVRETQLSRDDLVWTLIVSDSAQTPHPISAMPAIYRNSRESLMRQAELARDLGLPAIALFPHISPEHKDEQGREALNPEGLIPEMVRALKQSMPELGVIVDVALDPYTTHGHDGWLKGGQILNDETVACLTEVALVLAEAGADIIAPSDMMDGRIGAIRQAFENYRHTDTRIMSYAAKYASGFYGPYREAIGTSQTLLGDKRSYQMDMANSDEATREVALDIDEGADMILVKPGMPYLDIIYRLKQKFARPTFGFQVSGEYAMLMSASQQGFLDEKRVILESLHCFKRAGCDGIFTYCADRAAQWLGAEASK